MRSNFAIATTTLSLSFLGLALLLLWVPDNINQLTRFVENHPIMAPLFLISWRFLAIVIPPIPGGIVSLALLPILGWFQSFIYASIGVILGATTAFFLARKYEKPLVRKLVPLQHLHQWEGKFNEKTKFLAFLGIRLVTAPVFDFVSYIAGLSKISFRTFFFANILALLPDAVFFYVGEELYKRSALIAVFTIVGILLLYYSVKSHNISKPHKK
ncbi:hypothetical protein A3B55_02585 [Candidatus Daviesbacteria bacterium RIFCSPLOWO2_01_FULL_43_15]|nr:MAG: hypothetical protein A3B55_02585 [Candidatus Daviesbacteria bacterium RIFCSPLOWO2_01_FULL_43_15]